MADAQNVEEPMRFTDLRGIRVMLSEFSSIPGTADGELYRRWVDLNEPLPHNKTGFTIRSLGEAEANRLKNWPCN
jgi:hypothetical protein